MDLVCSRERTRTCSISFVNERLLTEDEAKVERLRNFYRNRPPVFENDWRRVLHQAADILDHLGWCRGALERDAHYCAVGAIIAADRCPNHARRTICSVDQPCGTFLASMAMLPQ